MYVACQSKIAEALQDPNIAIPHVQVNNEMTKDLDTPIKGNRNNLLETTKSNAGYRKGNSAILEPCLSADPRVEVQMNITRP